MTTLAILAQIILAVGIFNVWVVRRDRATAFRPDGAASLEEEFERYGFPAWFHTVIGSTKIALAVLLLVGIFVTAAAAPAASLLALLMVGAIGAHVRVRDPLVKSAPAFMMLVLSLVVVAGYAG